jgi:Xaa-Pro aminopeptidase
MNLAERLNRLRAELARQELDGFLVPRADEHLGEYVAPCAERLAWLTGFTGSAGLAAVLPDRAAVFTDGRYTLQLQQETDAALWERRHIVDDPAPAWLAAQGAPGAKIGYDPWLFSEEALSRFREAGLLVVPIAVNPIDIVWQDRPPPPMGEAVEHPIIYAGRTSADKRTEIAEALRRAGQQAAVITDPASVAWLLNIRGHDMPFTPYALSFAVIRDDGRTDLFIEPEKVSPDLRAWLGNAVSVHPRTALASTLAGFAGQKVRVDPAGSPAWFAQTLREAGAEPAAGSDPCLLAKACKNEVERQGARNAHRRDAVAVCRFLYFLDQDGPGGALTEATAANRLLALRQEVQHFSGESFPAISGAGEHGAIIHYRVSEATDRPIHPDELYLIDSGAQYPDGTTDITRTVWIGRSTPPAILRDTFTRVLKGHIAIATLVFPVGVCGAHLDAFARQALWQVGLDYDHGTGHGVGSFLSVHEGPVSLSRMARPVPLAAGMILSDEPGYYLPGEYGMRLENLLLVVTADLPESIKPFLRFETLTLAPFDRRLIAAEMLTSAERRWLDSYHQRVFDALSELLPPDIGSWLKEACAPLAP